MTQHAAGPPPAGLQPAQSLPPRDGMHSASGYAYYALGVLFLVYTLNFLDRILINMLFRPIKDEMRFTDLQLALLGSTSFVLFYTALGIPFGRLADRVTRKRLIAAGLFLWCLFSGMTGFARGFGTLFLCRVFVGIGEATLGPAALSLLSDYFPRRMRATVGAIYSAGIPAGAALAQFLGGLIGQEHGWRWAFSLLGFPGLVFCALVLGLREPPRAAREEVESKEASADWRVLLRLSVLRYHNLGYALLAVSANSLNMWMPTYMSRVFGLNLAQVGRLLGLMTLTGGLTGTILGGYLADRMQRLRPGGRMLCTSLGAFLCVPMWLLLLSVHSLGALLVPSFVLAGCGLMWLGPAAADVHDIVGPKLRGLGVAVYFFVVNLIGYGIGPPIFGALNDWLGVAQDAERMRTSLLLSPVLCGISAIVLYLGSRRLARR